VIRLLAYLAMVVAACAWAAMLALGAFLAVVLFYACSREPAPAQPPSPSSALGRQPEPWRPHWSVRVTPTGIGRTPTWERHGRARGAAGKAGRAPGPCRLEDR